MFESLQRAIDATHSWLFSAAVQIALIYSPLRPLEAWTPAERWNDRHGVGIVYTALHRLGASPLAMFLLLTPIEDSVTNGLRSVGFTPWNLDVLRPVVTGVPIVGFVLHLIALDAVDYVVHRAQPPFAGGGLCTPCITRNAKRRSGPTIAISFSTACSSTGSRRQSLCRAVSNRCSLAPCSSPHACCGVFSMRICHGDFGRSATF